MELRLPGEAMWTGAQRLPQPTPSSRHPQCKLRTKEGSVLFANRDILVAVCKGVAELAKAEGVSEIESGSGEGASSSGSLSGLSAITQQFSEAAVGTFLGEVYACSGVVKPPPGEVGLAAWNALGPGDQYDAIRLADMLQAVRVLAAWDAMLSTGVGQDLGSNDLICRLLLADSFQGQLPRTYSACMRCACERASQGVQGAIKHVHELKPASCTALLIAMQASLASADTAASGSHAQELAVALTKTAAAEGKSIVAEAAAAGLRVQLGEQRAAAEKVAAGTAAAHAGELALAEGKAAVSEAAAADMWSQLSQQRAAAVLASKAAAAMVAGKLAHYEKQASTAEGRASTGEAKAREAEGRALMAEGRASLAEGKVSAAEARASRAEHKLWIMQVIHAIILILLLLLALLSVCTLLRCMPGFK